MRIMAMVCVFPLMTVVMAKKSVVQARTMPIPSIIAPIITLEKSFIWADICVMAEKQKEENRIKKTSVFLLLRASRLKSSKKE